MMLQEVFVLKCSHSKEIISAQSTLLRSATLTHPGHKQGKYGTYLARKSHRSMDVVRSLFHRAVSRCGDTPLAARSPDITLPDFFLCGYLKE
jgi:hypothetical protein